jgi:hypothetical protein
MFYSSLRVSIKDILSKTKKCQNKKKLFLIKINYKIGLNNLLTKDNKYNY